MLATGINNHVWVDVKISDIRYRRKGNNKGKELKYGEQYFYQLLS